MLRVEVYLPEKVVQRLDATAKREGIKRGAVARRELLEWDRQAEAAETGDAVDRKPHGS